MDDNTYVIDDRIYVDADCPSCGWPERIYSIDSRTFGCHICDYKSDERDD